MAIKVLKSQQESSRIGSVRSFLGALERIQRSNDFVFFFRGHSNQSYELKPSIYREKGWIDNEDILFKELILKCPLDFVSNESTFQTLVRMQHYSLPTRLLDLTANPLIALHFACREGKNPKENGEVVVLKIPKKDVKYFDSDTVSVISNISRRPSTFNVPNLSNIDKLNAEAEIKYLLHEIKKEKPYFEPKIKKEHLESVVCVKPKLDNARIIRQDGAFLLFGVSSNKSRSAIVPPEYVEEFRINPILIIPEEKKNIRKQLEALGITQATIYPEIENVANYIKEIYKDESNRIRKAPF